MRQLLQTIATVLLLAGFVLGGDSGPSQPAAPRRAPGWDSKSPAETASWPCRKTASNTNSTLGFLVVLQATLA